MGAALWHQAPGTAGGAGQGTRYAPSPRPANGGPPVPHAVREDTRIYSEAQGSPSAIPSAVDQEIEGSGPP